MEIHVPTLPESDDSASVSALYVQEGESVSEGQVLLELETSKVVLEITAVADGIISGVAVSFGDYVNSDQTLMVLSGADVSVYEKSETIAVDPDSYGLEEEISVPSTKNESSSFGLFIGVLVIIIIIISIALG